MELETVNKLYLELSQIATATTAKEIELQKNLDMATAAIQEWCDAVDRGTSWDDWDSEFKYCKYKLLPELKK